MLKFIEWEKYEILYVLEIEKERKKTEFLG